MNTCIIFCAGLFDCLIEPIDPTDLIIAADGGLAHCQKLGIHPHITLGDFDSLGYTPKDAQIFPVEKDDTDAMLAVRRGLEAGYRRFVLYGSLDGPRLDHTVANMQTLLFLAAHGAHGHLVGLHQTVSVVRNGTLTYSPQCRGIFSLFCFGTPARGVTLQGLYYPLADGTLTPDFPLGVSNHFTGEAAAVTVKSGTLLAVTHCQPHLPQYRPEVV